MVGTRRHTAQKQWWLSPYAVYCLLFTVYRFQGTACNRQRAVKPNPRPQSVA
jgi:hypothetical protein